MSAIGKEFQLLARWKASTYDKFEMKCFFTNHSYLVVFDGVNNFSSFTFDWQDVAGNDFPACSELPLRSKPSKKKPDYNS